MRVVFHPGPGLLQAGDHQLTLKGQTARLFDLLLNNKGRAVTYAEIEGIGVGSGPYSRDRHGNQKQVVMRLRRELLGTGLLVVTHRGVGFELVLGYQPGETPLGIRINAIFGWLRILEPVA